MRDVITADYTIMMSRTLEVMVIIMLSSHALCCFPSVKKQKHDFHFFSFNVYSNKTIDIRSFFVCPE